MVRLSDAQIANILTYCDATTIDRTLRINGDFEDLGAFSTIWDNNLYIQGARRKENQPFTREDFLNLNEKIGAELVNAGNGEPVFKGVVISMLTTSPFLWILDGNGSIYSTLPDSIVWIRSEIPERVVRIRTFNSYSILAITEVNHLFILGPLNQYRTLINETKEFADVLVLPRVDGTEEITLIDENGELERIGEIRELERIGGSRELEKRKETKETKQRRVTSKGKRSVSRETEGTEGKKVTSKGNRNVAGETSPQKNIVKVKPVIVDNGIYSVAFTEETYKKGIENVEIEKGIENLTKATFRFRFGNLVLSLGESRKSVLPIESIDYPDVEALQTTPMFESEVLEREQEQEGGWRNSYDIDDIQSVFQSNELFGEDPSGAFSIV